MRDRLLAQLAKLIDGSHTPSAIKRAELRGAIFTKPGHNRYLRVTPGGLLNIDHAWQMSTAHQRFSLVRRRYRLGLQAAVRSRAGLARPQDHASSATNCKACTSAGSPARASTEPTNLQQDILARLGLTSPKKIIEPIPATAA